MKKLVLCCILGTLLALLLLPVAAQAQPSFNQAIDQLTAQGYPQGLDTHLANMPGTNPQLGFFLAGTWSDNNRARYIAQQMRAMGLVNVHLEPVPVDAFTFISAGVTIGGHKFVASTWAGTPPTAANGITAPIVYAHDGTAQDFDALQSAGISVKGKLVLLDADLWTWWINYQVAEATLRGAVGVVFTHGENTGPYYTRAPDALGSFDGEFDWSDVPSVYISQQDGDWLRGQLKADGTGPVVTMTLKENVRFATEGGTGYNVFGDLPGTSKDGTFVLFGGHHDGYFHTATDDTDGVVAEMLIAKAMIKSGYEPKHTVRLMATTGEDFGYVNSYFDWCIGSWYAITHTHPEWAGKIRALLNTDHIVKDNPLKISSPDFTPLVTDLAKASTDLLPHGYTISSTSSTWKDSWTFGASGVPVVNFENKLDSTGDYHTQYMRPDLIDWNYFANITKFIFKVEQPFNDGGLLPYGLKSRADSLANTVVPDDLLGAGANTGAVDRLQTAVTAFQAAAGAFEARKGSISASDYAAVNASLLKIQKETSLALTGLSPWQSTIYPHEQVLSDLQCLNDAIAALDASPADTDTALSALAGVDLTSNGLMLSHEVYAHLLTRLDPSYDRVAWGAQGHPVWPLLDVMPQYNAIQAGTWDAQTVAELAAMRTQERNDLDSRLNEMSAALEQITPQIDALK